MDTNGLPEWIKLTVQQLLNVFSLTGWTVKVEPSNLAPEGHNDSLGVTKFNVEALEAWIYFNEHLKPNEHGVEIVAHEVLHLVFAEMRELVAEQIISQAVLDDDKERLQKLYDYAGERAITVLSRGIARHYFHQALQLPEVDAGLREKLLGGNND